jgi:hypothetical protein
LFDSPSPQRYRCVVFQGCFVEIVNMAAGISRFNTSLGSKCFAAH